MNQIEKQKPKSKTSQKREVNEARWNSNRIMIIDTSCFELELNLAHHLIESITYGWAIPFYESIFLCFSHKYLSLLFCFAPEFAD